MLDKVLNDIIDEQKILTESSLSRIWEYMKKYDTGLISGYRSKKYKINEHGDEIPEFSGERYTHKENMQRNRKLLALLQSKRYGVTSVKGSYIENYGSLNAEEVGEHTFFVVDIDNKVNLENDLRNFGEILNQDSIMFIPKKAEKAILYGTNKVDKDAYPGYNKSLIKEVRKLGSNGEFFTKIGNSPFTFENIIKEHCLPDGYLGRMSCASTSIMNWKDIEI